MVSLVVFVDVVGCSPAYEDFTIYTEVDVPANHIQLVGTNHIDFEAHRDEDCYLYKDYGVDYFTDFEHWVDVRIVSGSANYVGNYVWALAHVIDDMKGIRDANEEALGIQFYYNTVVDVSLVLVELEGGNYHEDTILISLNTWYYLKIIKSGVSLTCEICSTEAKRIIGGAVDIGTLSLTLVASHSHRYVYGCNTYNSATDRYTVNDVENLDLFEVEDYYFLNFSGVGCNSTMLGTVVEFCVLWSSNGTLTSYVFGWNFSGSWVDDDSVDFEGESLEWSNVSKDLGVDVGMWHYVVEWRVNATTQGGTKNDTGLESFVVHALVVTFFVPDVGVLKVNCTAVSNSTVKYVYGSLLVVDGLPSSGFCFYNFTENTVYYNGNPSNVSFSVSNFMVDFESDFVMLLGVGGDGFGESDLSAFFWFGVLLVGVVVFGFGLIFVRREWK